MDTSIAVMKDVLNKLGKEEFVQGMEQREYIRLAIMKDVQTMLRREKFVIDMVPK